MPQSHQTGLKTIELSKVAKTEEDIARIRQHLKDVIEGSAFRGSQRSGQFLTYIVEQAVAGHFEALKERVIGVELFGRDPAYDTGEDAIVRVTASDVRKRLLQHYGRYGTSSEFRISLPPGSYIPEISRDVPREIAAVHADPAPVASNGAPTVHQIDATAPVPVGKPEIHHAQKPRRWILACLVASVAGLALWGLFWNRSSHKSNAGVSILPWSALLSSPRPLQLVASDPDIAEIQGYSNQIVTVSDYANHNYIPNPDQLTPAVRRLCQILLRGNKASLVDTPIAVSIAELAYSNARKVMVHPARSVQLANLQTDDNFVLLGSPRSNPWTGLFSDQLNFRFVNDKNSRQEIIRNVHPGPHEQAEYVPTALGWATGQSYAIIAFVHNPEQNGNVLLLAGANAEGTEAAGKLITDLPRLSAVLKNCGISPSGPLQYFELLLRLNMMAGSPTNVDVQACHVLSGNPIH